MIYIPEGGTSETQQGRWQARSKYVNIIRRIFNRNSRSNGTRFERYYGTIARSGAGFPTADEARRDLTAYDRTNMPYGWPH